MDVHGTKLSRTLFTIERESTGVPTTRVTAVGGAMVRAEALAPLVPRRELVSLPLSGRHSTEGTTRKKAYTAIALGHLPQREPLASQVTRRPSPRTAAGIPCPQRNAVDPF